MILMPGQNISFIIDGRPDGWRSMDSAPRDGTLIELKCSYGIAPWYCIARWTEDRWIKPDGGGPYDERTLEWRPYEGDAQSYVDPTAGAQNSPDYWRRAAAMKYGLPPNYFDQREPWGFIGAIALATVLLCAAIAHLALK